MRLKPRKRSLQTLARIDKVYDADTDEIITLWSVAPYMLNCPILKTCMECGLCHVRRD